MWTIRTSQQESKYHGKLRTKFDRMALSMHALYMVCKSFTQASAAADFTVAGDWSPNFEVPLVISKKAIQMAYLLAEKCEKTWKILDFARSDHSLPNDVLDRASQPNGPVGPGAAPAPEAQQDTQESINASVAMLIDTVGDKMRGKYCFTKEFLDKIVPLGTPVVKATLDKFPLFGCSFEILVNLMRVILVEPGRYFSYGNQGQKTT